FGTGLHYTNFSSSIRSNTASSYAIADLMTTCKNSNAKYLDLCSFGSPVQVEVTNTGKTTSDYVTLAYVTGTFGPAPHPKKALVSYQRLFAISGGSSDTAILNLTLGSLARVDEKGNKVLYPGEYTLLIDNKPLAMVNFTLTGDQVMLENWPQPPANRTGKGLSGFEGYFVGGYGSDQKPISMGY
ncbi:hypothetical protein P171DRAFT_348679, partial [Karstenula rhodostoma CBS 690.94]